MSRDKITRRIALASLILLTTILTTCGHKNIEREPQNKPPEVPFKSFPNP